MQPTLCDLDRILDPDRNHQRKTNQQKQKTYNLPSAGSWGLHVVQLLHKQYHGANLTVL